MALTKEIKNDKIEVIMLDAGYPVIQVRTATIIKDDGAEISRQFHRKALNPTDDLSGEGADVVAIAQTVFTEEAKNTFAAFEQSNLPN